MNILVIGSGAWGKALAATFQRAGSLITVWGRKELESPAEFPALLDLIVLVIPSHALRSVCLTLKNLPLPAGVPLLLCCKGIERQSLMLMSEVANEILPDHPVAVLSGPNFAIEIEQGLPSATTIACSDSALGNRLVRELSSNMFRPYFTEDIIGAQIGGAVKNVLAIACGIIAGKALGENAKAALITRGLAEMGRLCVAKGGKIETLLGLSGMGDLILTCGSPMSRNMSFGIALAKGGGIQAQTSLTEGVSSAESVVMLGRKLGITMPICEAIYAILYQNADIDSTIQQLLQRPLTQEM